MFSNRIYCGEITADYKDKNVTVFGWIDRKRDLGGIVFLEIRDVSGIIQAVFDSSVSTENAELADSVIS